MISTNQPSVKAIFVLDSDGNRICAKYYDSSYSTLSSQQALEKKIYDKTKNTNARSEVEVIMLDNIISVYRSGSDTTFYIIGSSYENELILSSVLEGVYEAVAGMLRGNTERGTMLDNLELALLTFDEVVDGGVILETDPKSITNRVLMRGIDNEVPMSELTISQAFASAKEQFAKSWTLK